LEGFVNKYGVKHKDGTQSIYFKPDEATRSFLYSDTGNAMTLYQFTSKSELFFKEFDNEYKPHWSLVENDENVAIFENYEFYLNYLRNLEE
jgi:hypothetical protein